MTTHITIEFTDQAAEAIGEQTSTSFSYDQSAHCRSRAISSSSSMRRRRFS